MRETHKERPRNRKKRDGLDAKNQIFGTDNQKPTPNNPGKNRTAHNKRVEI